MTSLSAIGGSPLTIVDDSATTVTEPTVLVSESHFELEDENGMVHDASMSVVIQDSEDMTEAIDTALEEAGVADLSQVSEIAVVEIPPPIGSDSDTSMFVVLWGRAVHALTWIDSLPTSVPALPDVAVTESSALRPEVMAGVLTAGNMAFGVSGDNQNYAHYSLTRWLAVANPARAAWEALDRFFLGMGQIK